MDHQPREDARLAIRGRQGARAALERVGLAVYEKPVAFKRDRDGDGFFFLLLDTYALPMPARRSHAYFFLRLNLPLCQKPRHDPVAVSRNGRRGPSWSCCNVVANAGVFAVARSKQPVPGPRCE